MADQPTQEQIVEGLLQVALAIGTAIRELGEVPSGHLYARVSGHLSLEAYERCLALLQEAGTVAVDGNHLVRWVGP